MRPAVQSLIWECRKAVAAEVVKAAALSDTHVLMALDQLLCGDAQNDLTTKEYVLDFEDDETDEAEDEAKDAPGEEGRAESERLRRLERELARERKAREQDSKLIDGLRKRLAGADDAPPIGGA